MSDNFIQENIEYNQAEWVFQFEKEEPVVFAWCNKPRNSEEPMEELHLKLKADSSSIIEFKDRHGKTFKIFAREITEPTLKMLEQDHLIEDEEI